MTTAFKKQMSPRNGRWWALVDKVGDVETWASLGKVQDLDVKRALGCYRIALFYYAAGILQTISSPLVRCDQNHIIGVINSDGIIEEPKR